MLDDHLKRLISTADGAIGAAVVNSDGVVIDVVSMQPCVEPAGGLSEYGMVVQQLAALNDVFPLGESPCCVVRTSERVTLLRRVNAKYFVALWIRASAQVAQAGFRLRLAAAELRASV